MFISYLLNIDYINFAHAQGPFLQLYLVRVQSPNRTPHLTMAELKKDPAIERWAAMREHTHFYYRFNFRKIIPTAVMLIGIPAGIVYFSLISFVSVHGVEWNVYS